MSEGYNRSGSKEVKRLGQLLVEDNYISVDQLQEALELQQKTGKRLGEQLVELGYLQADSLIKVLSARLGIPRVDLNQYNLDQQLACYLPEHNARRYQVVPLEKRQNSLKVAMVDPTDLITVNDLEMYTELKIIPYFATQQEIKQALNQIYTITEENTAEVFASLSAFRGQEEPEIAELKKMVEEAPIVRLTNLIINQAVQLKASDIHIEPQSDLIQIRYRVDGVLREGFTAPKYSQAALISRLKILANLDITIRRIPQDGRVEINVKDQLLDLRISTVPLIHGEKVVIRLLNRDKGLLDLYRLGFSKNNLLKIKEMITHAYGIVLLTGPTGSGKTTTLFAILNYLKSVEKNIITIEDPVEYRLAGINQIQVQRQIELTFPNVLRAILRQDPDIIMVGEIRDEETARIAVRAALTGHLVLSTLHTNNAVSAVTRLIDMGIPPYLVASTVIGIIAQRLVRKLCQFCKIENEPAGDYPTSIRNDQQEKLFQERIFSSAGCKQCNLTGYKGRTAIQEVLLLDSGFKKIISGQSTEQELAAAALEQGMTSLLEDGISKVNSGITSLEEIYRVVNVFA